MVDPLRTPPGAELVTPCQIVAACFVIPLFKRYRPGGNSNVPPSGIEFSAAWIAAVSSATPSPLTP
jgi:hypothetical protein